MIHWDEIESAQPTPDLLALVSAELRSPDPGIRDGLAYEQFCRWVPLLAPDQLGSLGDRMAERFADPEIQARTFAALVLAEIVDAGAHQPSWLEAFARWYPAETDLRGWDGSLGWLHAVAHGADLLAAFGRSPLVDPAPLLDVAAARLTAPTDHVWDALEDDRLGQALALVLTRAELTERQSVAWLEPIAAREPRRPGTVPAPVSNTLRTLRVLYLLADRGVRPARGAEPLTLRHAGALKRHLAEVLAVNAPYAG
ncbi:DUF2785 domain-containing protein [Kitasatospora sp. NPDC058170]|uniref:DUF2785 domain-containing protein n=1 Tax=Kitasatospora sp. NPDC058170 TaxID=3346364 RepID=UPI0036D803B0